MTKKKFLIFDFFGVICSEVASVWFPKNFGPIESEELREKLSYLIDSGQMSKEELFDSLSKKINKPSLEIENEWRNLAVINSGVLDLIGRLKDVGYKNVLLTNACSGIFREIVSKNQIKLDKYFDLVVVSSEVKMVKPEKDIFELTLKDLNCDPVDALMIDDNPKNIQGARLVGIEGFVFTNLLELERQLAAHGVKTLD